jgi:hypothetical protein
MEIKSVLKFEVTKNERTYSFSVPAGAPYGETYDAIFGFLNQILENQKTNLEQLKSQKTETN